MSKKRSTGLAVACCLLVALIVFILFLVKKDQIFTNLKETDFFGRVFGKTPEFVQNHVSKNPSGEEQIPLQEEVPLTINIQDEPPVIPKPPVEDEVVKVTETPKKEEPKKETPKKEEKPAKPVEYTTYQLCFVEIDSDGSVNRKMVKRTVEKNDSPLTTAINLLIKGPDSKLSGEKNCMSLIPEGTRLLSAKVSNGVAYLNFNDAFEINPVGVEGYIGQLMQIVYTATTFSTVSSVQFLIEGQKKDYLGSEGQWIGSPLNKNSFSR
jgi:spore germination protein GerM